MHRGRGFRTCFSCSFMPCSSPCSCSLSSASSLACSVCSSSCCAALLACALLAWWLPCRRNESARGEPECGAERWPQHQLLSLLALRACAGQLGSVSGPPQRPQWRHSALTAAGQHVAATRPHLRWRAPSLHHLSAGNHGVCKQKGDVRRARLCILLAELGSYPVARSSPLQRCWRSFLGAAGSASGLSASPTPRYVSARSLSKKLEAMLLPKRLDVLSGQQEGRNPGCSAKTQQLAAEWQPSAGHWLLQLETQRARHLRAAFSALKDALCTHRLPSSRLRRQPPERLLCCLPHQPPYSALPGIPPSLLRRRTWRKNPICMLQSGTVPSSCSRKQRCFNTAQSLSTH